MKLGIMQPYFLPYIGYFSIIKHTDEFILFDSVQFIRHGWIERNRILKQSGGWQYIQVPIIKNNGRDTLIKDIRINNTDNWKAKILAQIQHYKKKAPHYNDVIQLLNQIFTEEFHSITSLNKKSIEMICSYLGINRKFPIFSEMNLKIDKVSAPDEWALNICKALGANYYINPIGGLEFFDRTKYQKQNIEIRFMQSQLTEYNQLGGAFEAGLSIVDVLMFNSIDEVNMMLDKYTLI